MESIVILPWLVSNYLNRCVQAILPANRNGRGQLRQFVLDVSAHQKLRFLGQFRIVAADAVTWSSKPGIAAVACCIRRQVVIRTGEKIAPLPGFRIRQRGDQQVRGRQKAGARVQAFRQIRPCIWDQFI